MEFCNKGMVQADPPPSYGSKTIFLHFFGTLPLLGWGVGGGGGVTLVGGGGLLEGLLGLPGSQRPQALSCSWK